MEMTIGRAAVEAGVHVETIRYYERCGLIERPQARANGGYRVYPVATIARVRFIRKAKSLGFSLRDVRGLLDQVANETSDCGEVRTRATDRLEKLDTLLRELKRKRRALIAMIEACPGEGPVQNCTILEALDSRLP